MSRNEQPRVDLEDYLSPGFSERVTTIGLGNLSAADLTENFEDIRRRAAIGLGRKDGAGLEVGGLRSDQGLAAFKTEIPPLTQEAWERIPDGTESYVVNVGGTVFGYHHAKKENGLIETKKLGQTSYPEKSRRHLTFSEFVSRITDPIITNYKNKVIKPDKIRLGVSLAFPHSNRVGEDGIDALLEPTKPNGTLPKHWKITDWEKIDPKDRGLIGAIKRDFAANGINTEIEIVVINDTAGVEFDVNAVNEAREKRLPLLPVSAVGGSGVNHAVNQNGLINFESGRATVASNRVTERMIQNLRKETGAEILRNELEHETGGQYIIERLRAGIEILGEDGLIDLKYAQHISEKIKQLSEHNPDLIGQIAEGHTEIQDRAIQNLARRALIRAAQFFGLTTAAILEASLGSREGGEKAVVLAEGSFLHNGVGVKREAEQIAARLGQPIEFIKASSVRGMAALSMSWKTSLLE
jgi:hypothetical protein